MGLLDFMLGGEQGQGGAKSCVNAALVKQTDNVPEALKEAAGLYCTTTAQVDFSVQGTLTEVKIPGTEQATELTPALIGKLNDKGVLTDPDFTIRQVHQITFRPTAKNPELFLDMEIAADKFRTRAVATIKTTSKVHDFANLREFVIGELNKLKLRYGMIINVREGTMRTDVGHLINKIRVHAKVPEPFKIQLCEWASPVPTVDDDLILHYKGKDKKAPTANERVDYADRGFVNAVEAGDLLIEYVKPKMGIPGRDFRGQYLPVREPKLQYGPVMSPDPESIEVREDERAITYYAKREGYVSFNLGALSVGDTLEVESVDFKHTGDIKAGTDKDVKISIKGKDANEDHIGPNTKIEASEIELSGSIANGAIVKANKIVVKGQTHSTSHITAAEAEIAVHRGTLEGVKVKIDRLEHGRVNAEEVEIDRVIGGMVSAKRITVGTLHSHATLIASERITIKQLVGGENRLYIEAAASKNDKMQQKALMEKQRTLAKQHDEIARKYNQKRAALLRNKTQAEQIKMRIETEKKAGRTPPSLFIERYRQYLEEMKNARYLHDELDSIKTQMGNVQDEITLLQDAVMNAVIVNKDLWRNYNEIRFRLISPPKEILYVPPENSKATEIKVEMAGLDEYIVKAYE